MKPLSILHVTSSETSSGGTRQAFVLIRGLCAVGHRVLLCAPPGARILGWAGEAGIEVRALPMGSLRRKWTSSRELRRLARGFGADVVHAHHTHGHNVALLATFGGRFPPVLANRGVVYRPEFPLKFRSRRTAAIITNSGAAKRVLEEAGVPGGKVHVVYNAKEALDLEALAPKLQAFRREWGLEGPGPVVGTVGSGRPAKGFQFLVEAAPAILRECPEARFLLIGGGVERHEARIAELGLQGSFRLTGNRRDAAELLPVLDVFVLPSLSESCPNVLLEAMAAGVPSVCSDVGGVRELLERSESGRLVPPAAPPRIATEVCALLADREASRRAGARGRRAILDSFSTEKKVEGTLTVYREVLRARGEGR